jgi:DNA-binding XRE family transcriptional regulator
MATRKSGPRHPRPSPVLQIHSPATRKEIASAFGKALEAHRLRAGLTQEQLAEAAGLDRTYPSLLERGLRVPTAVSVVQLATALGMTAGALLDSVDWPKVRR